MAQVFNHSTKQWEDRPDLEAEELVKSGSHTFGKDFQVPVVAPDGEIGSIPAANAQEAFKKGFRLQTKADLDEYAKKETARIQQERFDDPALAATLGLMRGATLGASDVLLSKGLGLGEEVKAVKEQSPVISGVGSAVGAVGSMLAAPATGALGVAGIAGRGAKAVTAAAEARGAGTVGKALVEGAYWGAGEGVSEAALGNPDEAVDNLIANIGFGALTGGIFGAAGVGARASVPYMQKLADGFLDLGEKTIKGTARQIVEKVSVPVLNATGQRDLAKMFPEIVGNEALLKDLVAQGRYAEAKEIYKQGLKSAKAVEKESARLTKDVQKLLGRVPADEAEIIKQSVNEAGKDIRQALANNHTRLEEMGAKFDQFRNSLTGPAVLGDDFLKEIDRQVVKMSKYGGAAKSTANEIRSQVKAFQQINPTEGSEANLVWSIKQLVDSNARKQIKGDAHTIAKKLWSTMDDTLKNRHPNAAIRDHWSSYDKLYRANSELKKVIKKKGGPGIDEFLFNPNTQKQVSAFISDLSSFGPELANLHAAGSSLAARKQAMEAFKQKFKDLTGEAISPENIDAFKELADAFAPKAAKKLDRLKEIQTTMVGLADDKPMDALAKIYRATGKDIAELEPYARFYQNWDKLEALQKASSGDKLGLPTRGLLGYGVGGPVGAGLALAGEAASNPLRVVQYLGQINNAAEKGRAALSKAFGRVSKSLTDPKMVSRATVGAIKAEPMERKRQAYDRVTKKLAELSSPEAMARAIEEVSGNAESMPQFKMAMALRLQAAASYLQEAMPEDPLAGAQLTIRSPWKPSDLDVAAFNRKYNAVMNPLSVVDKVADGTATLDEVQALAAVHPDIYSGLQNAIMSGIMENGDKIPYSRRVLLGNLFNIPADYSLTPEFIAQMQQPYQLQDQGGRPSAQGPTGDLEISPFDTVQTETSRITYST